MEAKTLNEIHKQGIDALVKELGPVDAVEQGTVRVHPWRGLTGRRRGRPSG